MFKQKYKIKNKHYTWNPGMHTHPSPSQNDYIILFTL